MNACDKRILSLQSALGLSDGKLAKALGVTRQTVRNWRRGCKVPQFADNSIRWLLALHAVDPANDNLPDAFRAKPATSE